MINSPYFSLFEMSDQTIHALGSQVTHAEMMDPNFLAGIKIEQVQRAVQTLDLSRMLSVADLDHLYSGKVAPSVGKR